jgi:hypothetical protein
MREDARTSKFSTQQTVSKGGENESQKSYVVFRNGNRRRRGFHFDGWRAKGAGQPSRPLAGQHRGQDR